MNLRRRHWVAGSALALLLAGCERRSGGPVELRLWAMGREGEVVKELLADFERANPGIRIKVQQLPWLSAQEKLLTAFAGDVTPDLCQLGNTWIPQFAALGAIEPLGDRIDRPDGVASADYFPGIWASNQIDAQLFGVPWYVDTRLIYYRKDLLLDAGYAKAPVSWAEWTEAMRAVKQRSPQNYGVLLPLNEYEQLLSLALQQEAPLLREGGRFGDFRHADFRATLQFYLDLFMNGLAPRLSATAISNVWDEFAKGFFAFYISGPWNIGEFKRRLPPEKQHTWMTAPLPGPRGAGASVAGGASLVVFKASQHKEEAWKVVEYLSQPAVQRRFYQMTGNLPPRRSAWDDPALQDDPYSAAFREQLERAKSPPKVPEWERIGTEMRIVTEALVAGRMTIEQAVTELDARTDRILEKRRWMLDQRGRA
ncbi:sugar ABC transporter substrate-binding protein [Massilia scottii]|uniref:sugar ABC transporter substrate-binding protein n=1 Tax=Massilia scottii TaxID=3057166 RepID=UPI002796D935|nr:sugar ABC transporter substrate-binding protein [Massilia sp. CCM 9029]MDQ1832359.1 sugar ABC transporter substrate-binding protein [Massilia sp. CCM 9029]